MIYLKKNQLFTLQDVNWWSGFVLITSDVFISSLNTHSLAKDLLVYQRCNAIFLWSFPIQAYLHLERLQNINDIFGLAITEKLIKWHKCIFLSLFFTPASHPVKSGQRSPLSGKPDWRSGRVSSGLDSHSSLSPVSCQPASNALSPVLPLPLQSPAPGLSM